VIRVRGKGLVRRRLGKANIEGLLLTVPQSSIPVELGVRVLDHLRNVTIMAEGDWPVGSAHSGVDSVRLGFDHPAIEGWWAHQQPIT
jgi:hypothetical protein